jgi:hypothetical protein
MLQSLFIVCLHSDLEKQVFIYSLGQVSLSLHHQKNIQNNIAPLARLDG